MYIIVIFCVLIWSRSANSEGSWKGISEIAEEKDSISPKIIFGSIPKDIKGSVYKTGAGRIKLNNNLFYDHWFDGDGMATKLEFNGNGEIPLFTSKYIKTERYELQGNETKYFKIRGAWTQSTNWYHNILRGPMNPSNTNLCYFNNKLLSLCEGGIPIQININNLNTINNKYTFNKQLLSSSFFSAHPKIYFNKELNINIMINIGISISPPSTSFNLKIYAIKEDEGEEFLNTNSIQLPYNCLVHDFLITNNYIIILISPYIMSSINILKSIIFGIDSLGNYQEWQPELGSFLYILDKYTLDIILNKKIETISYWHWINAYDVYDDDGVHNIYSRLISFPTHTRSELEYKMKNLFKDDSVNDITPDLFGGIIGLNINLINQNVDILLYQQLNDKVQPFELPEVNYKYIDSPHFRYLYTNSISQNGLFLDSLQKIDVLQNIITIYSDIDKNIYLTSPLFIEKQNGSEKKQEDDGYIICYGYSVNNHNSLIYIFNASNISQVLTIMSLKFHLPILFHGTFVPKS